MNPEGESPGFLIMADNGKNGELTARQRLFAKLRYEDGLPNPQLAERCGIADRTIYEWDQKPEIQTEMARLGKADTERAQRILERASVKAAKRLEVLADTGTSEPPLAETGRKAACDILDSVNVTTKTIEQGAFTLKVISHVPGETD